MISLLERLKLNTDSKIGKNKHRYIELYKKCILEYLQNWFDEKDDFKNEKNLRRYEILKWKFDDHVLEMMDYFDGSIDEMSDTLNIDVNDLVDFLYKNNNLILKECIPF